MQLPLERVRCASCGAGISHGWAPVQEHGALEPCLVSMNVLHPFHTP